MSPFTHGRRDYEDDEIETPKITSGKHISPAEARLGMASAPEIPPCKYPVGTVLQRYGDDSSSARRIRITHARLMWVYDWVNIDTDLPHFYAPELHLSQYCAVPPDPYPVGSEHDVDLGLLGAQTAKVVSRDNGVVTFEALGSRRIVTVAEFEKAVVV
jgi:hypothetical protein